MLRVKAARETSHIQKRVRKTIGKQKHPARFMSNPCRRQHFELKRKPKKDADRRFLGRPRMRNDKRQWLPCKHQMLLCQSEVVRRNTIIIPNQWDGEGGQQLELYPTRSCRGPQYEESDLEPDSVQSERNQESKSSHEAILVFESFLEEYSNWNASFEILLDYELKRSVFYWSTHVDKNLGDSYWRGPRHFLQCSFGYMFEIHRQNAAGKASAWPIAPHHIDLSSLNIDFHNLIIFKSHFCQCLASDTYCQALGVILFVGDMFDVFNNPKSIPAHFSKHCKEVGIFSSIYGSASNIFQKSKANVCRCAAWFHISNFFAIWSFTGHRSKRLQQLDCTSCDWWPERKSFGMAAV